MVGPIEFIVRREADGGFCASAEVGETSIFTEAGSLDELYRMIEDALALYRSETGDTAVDFSMSFSHEPIAA